MNIDNLGGAPLTDEQIAFIKDATLSHQEVAALTGKSYASVKYHRSKYKIEVDEDAKDIRYWSEEEVQFLNDNADKTNEELARLLGRSVGGVALKRQRMNIPSTRDYWDDSEKEYLKENYKHLSVARVASELGRTVNGVVDMAYKLGLTKKSTGWSKSEIEILQNNIDLKPSELLPLLPNKTKEQITYKKNHLTFFNNQKVAIDDTDIERNVRISKHSLTLRYLELLNTLEVGDSLQFPAEDSVRIASARKELAHKQFVSKKEDDKTRRIWRIA